MTMETIPKEFKWHLKVFLEELSKQFPLNQSPNMTVKFLPDAPTLIKCKPYSQSKVEGEIEEAWVK